MDKFKIVIKGQEKNTFTIHYSCSGFYNGGAVAPTICCIALTNLKTQELHTFALHNYIIKGSCLLDAEKQLLRDFVNFYKSLKNPIFVHWRMDSLDYGFKAISARCENYGFYDLNLTNLKALDLSACLYNNLNLSLEKYQCDSPYLLDGKEEVSCFDKRNFNAVKLSTETKSSGLAKLLTLVLKDEIYIDDFDDEDDDEIL